MEMLSRWWRGVVTEPANLGDYSLLAIGLYTIGLAIVVPKFAFGVEIQHS